MSTIPCGDCTTQQLLEPDGTIITVIETDPAISESGSVPLTNGQTEAHVDFVVPKASLNYRFEYLYVDSLGLPDIVIPVDVDPVPILQTIFGFTVRFVSAPADGYILRWRVVVLDLEPTTIGNLDQPQTLYLQMPQAATFVVSLINPRSTTDYGFSELRVENLIDAPGGQAPIWVQVTQKTQVNFSLAVSPTPPSNNYFLAARIP